MEQSCAIEDERSDNVWFWNGRRRPFILIGGVLAGMMLLALPNIDIVSSALGISGLLGVAIAVALTLDLSINISFNPTRAIIADVTPEGDARTKGYTWMQTISGSFGVLAYAVGATWGNFVLIYLGAGLVFFLSIFAPFFITEPKKLMVSQTDTTQEKVSFKMVLSPPFASFASSPLIASQSKTDHEPSKASPTGHRVRVSLVSAQITLEIWRKSTKAPQNVSKPGTPRRGARSRSDSAHDDPAFSAMENLQAFRFWTITFRKKN